MGTGGYEIGNSLTQKRNCISNIVRAIGYDSLEVSPA